jgi:hypothetical protein
MEIPNGLRLDTLLWGQANFAALVDTSDEKAERIVQIPVALARTLEPRVGEVLSDDDTEAIRAQGRAATDAEAHAYRSIRGTREEADS